jgi:2-haloacid dehalogenase
MDRLRGGFVTATLSNGHVALLVDLVRFGGWRVDVVLSAELAASYKPDPAVYLRGAQLLGRAPEEVGMVAAHAGDLEAAAGVGLRPLFVRRPDEWGTGAPEDPPDLPGVVVADGLDDLAAQLGC